MSYEVISSFTYDGINYSAGEIFPAEDYTPSEYNVKMLLSSRFIKELDNKKYIYIAHRNFIYDGQERKEGEDVNDLVDKAHINYLLEFGFIDKIVVDESENSSPLVQILNQPNNNEIIQSKITQPAVKKPAAKKSAVKKKRR